MWTDGVVVVQRKNYEGQLKRDAKTSRGFVAQKQQAMKVVALWLKAIFSSILLLLRGGVVVAVTCWVTSMKGIIN
jgi:hypothetical protein